jgi:hypothetical protein
MYKSKKYKKQHKCIEEAAKIRGIAMRKRIENFIEVRQECV